MVTKTILDFQGIIQKKHLRLNTSDSELHVPRLTSLRVEDIHEFPNVVRSDSNSVLRYQLENDNMISLAHHGLKILGCPAGTDEFCATHSDLLCADIEKDLERLQDIHCIFTSAPNWLSIAATLGHLTSLARSPCTHRFADCIVWIKRSTTLWPTY